VQKSVQKEQSVSDWPGINLSEMVIIVKKVLKSATIYNLKCYP